MKQLQGDESVQSFIFRVLMLNGESDFAGVLNRMGEWRAFPFVATMHSHLFRPYDPEYLLSVLQRSAIANPVAGMFSNPLSHFELVPTVFRNGVENYSQQTQNNFLKVNFCVDCIADDLKNCGFGFFRAEWLNQKYCHHHKKALFNLTGKSQALPHLISKKLCVVKFRLNVSSMIVMVSKLRWVLMLLKMMSSSLHVFKKGYFIG